MTTETNTVQQIEAGTTPLKLPSDYQSLGVTRGYEPVDARDLRLFIMGPSGMGKSTFTTSMPRTLILDFEGGVSGIPNPIAHRVRVKNLDHLDQIARKIEDDSKNPKRPFDRVSVDTVDELAEWHSVDICKQKGVEFLTDLGHGKGYNMVRNKVWDLLRMLEQNGYAWTVVGHLTEKTITDPVGGDTKTVLRASVFDTLCSRIINNADFAGTIYCTKEVEQRKEKVKVGGKIIDKVLPSKEVTKYWLDVRSFGNKPGKTRNVTEMKAKIELPTNDSGWKAFTESYTEAVDKEKERLRK